MRSFQWIAAALAGALACGLDAGAQNTVYKWTDSDGKVHFTDTPPPQQAKNVTQKRMGGVRSKPRSFPMPRSRR
jgi:hypothetical protein